EHRAHEAQQIAQHRVGRWRPGRGPARSDSAEGQLGTIDCTAGRRVHEPTLLPPWPTRSERTTRRTPTMQSATPASWRWLYRVPNSQRLPTMTTGMETQLMSMTDATVVYWYESTTR